MFRAKVFCEINERAFSLKLDDIHYKYVLKEGWLSNNLRMFVPDNETDVYFIKYPAAIYEVVKPA